MDREKKRIMGPIKKSFFPDTSFLPGRISSSGPHCIFLNTYRSSFWALLFYSFQYWVPAVDYALLSAGTVSCLSFYLQCLASHLVHNWPSKNICRGFPGGTVVKNLPANARDTGSSPGPIRSHMPQSNWARAPQLLSLCSRAREPQPLSPCATTTEACVPGACAPQQKKPLQWEARAPHWKEAPARDN